METRKTSTTKKVPATKVASTTREASSKPLPTEKSLQLERHRLPKSSIVYSKSCIWLQDNHKDLSIQMLNKFHAMIPENETSDHCVTKIKPNDTRQFYNINQVESVAWWVRELFEQMLQFYTKHQEKLVSNQTAWKQLQEELYHQANLLEDCTSETTGKREKRIWNKYFSTLEKILKEQTLCGKRRIKPFEFQKLILSFSRRQATNKTKESCSDSFREDTEALGRAEDSCL
ncbi:uncharacterized protein LOC143768128 [Ranitomeya variabilis]|uniref:uncharacterized protein LOC143768128 n=1 Tax=Ranitomeya variabilis TaxID=490064 RepID=UPI004055EB88